MDKIALLLLGLIWMGAVLGLRWRAHRHAGADALWRDILAGGILFLMAALTGSIYFRGFSGNPGVLIVMLPFIITGVLFILHQVLSRQKQNNKI